MDRSASAEYLVLRKAIAARGSLRPILAVVGLGVWGAERIGRYLQVFYEEQGQPDRPLSDTPAWERVAMSLAPSVPGAAGHPLFVPTFLLAAVVNFLAVLLPAPVAIELSVMAVPHLAFIAWLIAADRAMRTQRAAELTRFRELRVSQMTQKI